MNKTIGSKISLLILLPIFLFLFSGCSNNQQKMNVTENEIVSGEFFTFSGIKIDNEDFGKPTSSEIVINADKADFHIPQAWSRNIDNKEYWYYNWNGAIIESKNRGKRLPTSEEWKVLFSSSINKFNHTCPGFRQGGSNIWSIPEKGGKSYWSSDEYVFNDDKANKDYALQISLYNEKCDSLGFSTRMEKWQGFSVRGISLSK